MSLKPGKGLTRPTLPRSKMPAEAKSPGMTNVAEGSTGPFVLVYAGDHTAFAIREFRTPHALATFMALRKLRRDECALIHGTVLSCLPAYRPTSTEEEEHEYGKDQNANP